MSREPQNKMGSQTSAEATRISPLKILGVSGSMGKASQSAAALKHVLDAAQSHGSATRLIDLRIADLPMFRPGESLDSPGLRQAVEDVEWADAFVLATPDYHGSMSGALKNFLDYHWKQLAGKLFGYLCASHEKGLLPMEQMRVAVRQCYGWSLPYGVAVGGDESVLSTAGEARLKMLGRDLSVYGRLIRDQFDRDIEDNVTETFAARYR
jgi:NAD(P)H-dependent FMN reductase